VLIPIGDEPNAHETPWVTYALIAANVLVFLLHQGGGRGAAYEASVEGGAYVPSAPSLQTALTSMFLHGSMMHLVGNMLFLWIFGDNVEAHLGRLGFLAAYLATGLAATWMHGLADPTSGVPSLGASGAISGVEGLYLVAFPRNRVKMLIWMFVYVNVFLVPAPVLIVLWFVLNDLFPFLSDGAGLGGVAHAAHLGGFAAGVLLCLCLKPLLRRAAFAGFSGRSSDAGYAPSGRRDSLYAPASDPRTFAGLSHSGPARPPAIDETQLLGLWRAGRFEAAADGLARALSVGAHPTLPESDFLQMACWLEQHGRLEDARRAFHAFLAAYPASREAGFVAFGLGLIAIHHDHNPGAARTWLDRAAATATDPAVREAAIRERAKL